MWFSHSRRSYPEQSGPTSLLYHTTRASDQTLPLYSTSFSGTYIAAYSVPPDPKLCLLGSGSTLVCGSADRSIYTIKMPPSTGKVSAFAGTRCRHIDLRLC